jgi:hypothetical protein
LDRKEPPRVLLASTLWWPLSARLATRFIHYGCDVSAICPRGHVLRHVTGIRRLYDYRSLDSRASLEVAIEATNPEIVIPCDDRVVWQLHELYRRRPYLRSLIESSLGSASQYDIVERRERLLEVAQALGIRVPETRRVGSEADVRAWFERGPTRSVIKVDGTCGGTGVQIVDSEAGAIQALGRLGRFGGLGVTVKRLLVNRDPLAIWTWQRQAQEPITIQRFIEGRPANAMVACWRGEALGSVTVEVLSSEGATGASVVVRVVENQEISHAICALTRRLELTGFCGLDFVIDGATGSANFIEMNPRCTQLGHLVLPARGDLVGALCTKLLGRVHSEPPAPIANEVVAFFPQSLLADPQSRFVGSALLDVPWEHPDLVRELLLPPWPDRHWVARLYHHFRPPRSTPTVDFADARRMDVAETSGARSSRRCVGSGSRGR